MMTMAELRRSPSSSCSHVRLHPCPVDRGLLGNKWNGSQRNPNPSESTSNEPRFGSGRHGSQRDLTPTQPTAPSSAGLEPRVSSDPSDGSPDPDNVAKRTRLHPTSYSTLHPVDDNDRCEIQLLGYIDPDIGAVLAPVGVSSGGTRRKEHTIC